jgi:dipeptidase D
MDTEEDDEIDIGCAGGIDATAEYDEAPGICRIYDYCKRLERRTFGMDIHKGWVMPIKL